MCALSVRALLCSAPSPVKLSGKKRRDQKRDKGKLAGISPKHSNLLNNVVPVSRRAQFLRQQSMQFFPHFNDSSRHGLDIRLPFLKQRSVVQNQRYLGTIVIRTNN